MYLQYLQKMNKLKNKVSAPTRQRKNISCPETPPFFKQEYIMGVNKFNALKRSTFCPYNEKEEQFNIENNVNL